MFDTPDHKTGYLFVGRVGGPAMRTGSGSGDTLTLIPSAQIESIETPEKVRCKYSW